MCISTGMWVHVLLLVTIVAIQPIIVIVYDMLMVLFEGVSQHPPVVACSPLLS